MPRAQDFSQSVIYHIRNKATKEVIYVGSSTSFQQRKAAHKNQCNNPNGNRYHLKFYVYIRENGNWDCFEIIPVEFLKLENKTQLEIAEQAEMDKQDNLKNQYKAHITEEQRKEHKKKYNETHKEESREYRKAHKEDTKEYNKEYRETHKEQYKEYFQEYYETHKEQLQENYEKNRDKVSAQRKEKQECPICKSNIRKCDIARHKRSAKCKSFIKIDLK